MHTTQRPYLQFTSLAQMPAREQLSHARVLRERRQTLQCLQHTCQCDRVGGRNGVTYFATRLLDEIALVVKMQQQQRQIRVPHLRDHVSTSHAYHTQLQH
jgi:hypothetical protein